MTLVMFEDANFLPKGIRLDRTESAELRKMQFTIRNYHFAINVVNIEENKEIYNWITRKIYEDRVITDITKTLVPYYNSRKELGKLLFLKSDTIDELEEYYNGPLDTYAIKRHNGDRKYYGLEEPIDTHPTDYDMDQIKDLRINKQFGLDSDFYNQNIIG